MKRRLAQLGEKQFFRLVDLKRADNAAQTADPDFRYDYAEHLKAIAHDIISRKDCLSLKNLSVNGSDLLALGLSGRDIGTALDSMLNAVIDGNVANEKSRLIEWYFGK